LCADFASAVGDLLFRDEDFHSCGGRKDGRTCRHKDSVARVGGEGKGSYT
jgi:hypothetical protein